MVTGMRLDVPLCGNCSARDASAMNQPSLGSWLEFRLSFSRDFVLLQSYQLVPNGYMVGRLGYAAGLEAKENTPFMKC